MTTNPENMPSKEDEHGNVLVPINLQLQELNDVSSLMLEAISGMAKGLKGNRKLKTVDKSQVLSRLVKSYADLVKTHRSINGLEHETTTNVNAGVIVIPGKEADWVSAAKRELDSAQAMLIEAQEAESPADASDKADGRTADE